eukprot:1156395-Pelagomonas_calceolata.AAC.5
MPKKHKQQTACICGALSNHAVTYIHFYMKTTTTTFKNLAWQSEARNIILKAGLLERVDRTWKRNTVQTASRLKMNKMAAMRAQDKGSCRHYRHCRHSRHRMYSRCCRPSRAAGAADVAGTPEHAAGTAGAASSAVGTAGSCMQLQEQ